MELSSLLAGSPAGHLIRLLLPMFVGFTLIASVGLVDAYFVGKLGTDAQAAFGFAFPAAMLMMALLMGFAAGVTSTVSRALGRQDRARAKAFVITGMAATTLVNLFIGDNRRHVLQFNNHSDRNDVRNNVFLGISIGNAPITTNGEPILVEIDTDTTSANVFVDNFYSGGRFEGHSPGASETFGATFDALWFVDFPLDRMGTAQGFRPTASAPYLDSGELLDTTPTDLSGKLRTAQTDLGPFER